MFYNPFSLLGKTVLVTGASSGIGQAVASQCSKMGARVIITGRDKNKLYKTFCLLDGDSNLQITADLTNEEDVNNLVTEIPSLDGVVYSAGNIKIKPLSFINSEDLEYVYKANTFSSFILTKILLKKKKLNKGASLVYISSISSFHNSPGRAIYASSKAALTSLMRSCAVELSEKNIRSNAIHPGMIETNFIDTGTFSTEDYKKELEQYPLKRYGCPDDVAYAVLYYLSDASSWVTGSSLVVDGGRMLK